MKFTIIALAALANAASVATIASARLPSFTLTATTQRPPQQVRRIAPSSRQPAKQSIVAKALQNEGSPRRPQKSAMRPFKPMDSPLDPFGQEIQKFLSDIYSGKFDTGPIRERLWKDGHGEPSWYVMLRSNEGLKALPADLFDDYPIIQNKIKRIQSKDLESDSADAQPLAETNKQEAEIARIMDPQILKELERIMEEDPEARALILEHLPSGPKDIQQALNVIPVLPPSILEKYEWLNDRVGRM